ncbi:MAG TPA: molybdopterin-dependent oxidoreductase [Syntrophorhabdaceae bacterium]|nr:molybdopterin-dependent oxidoreductase [Syntrophorhabdaceae bacterium]
MSRLRELNTPVFWVEGHPGTLDREQWTVEVAGACRHPKTISWEELSTMPKDIVDARLTSVTRFSVRGRWGGVVLSKIFAMIEPDSSAKYVRFWSIRSIYDTSIQIETALMEKVLLAYEFDGELLEEDYGGPVRLFCPYLWGYKSAKSVIRIELMDHYISGFWESRGYTDEALITAGKVRDMNEGGRIRSIPDGEVISFLDGN